MTKVIILKETTEELTKIPIKFVRILKEDGCWEDQSSMINPRDFLNIELISRSYTEDNLDLMFAYNKERSGNDFCCLYLGHFNDGVV